MVKRLFGTAAAGARIIGASLVLVATASPVLPMEASPWAGDGRSAVRVIAGAASRLAGRDLFRAGIEIRLGPGWKTYWRYPGDSGVPPLFDFAGSENVGTVTLLWPAPQRFVDGGASLIGYSGDVVFPVHVEPRDPSKPVVLHVDLSYAICEKLCVPEAAKTELALTGQASSLDSTLASSEARVPKSVGLGETGALAIVSVFRTAGESRPRVIVDVSAPQDVHVDLFAEGPTADWALPLPEPIPGVSPGLHRFAFNLDGLPPGAKPDGAVIKLTAVAGDSAIEVTTRLD